jgi:hypothetical protein
MSARCTASPAPGPPPPAARLRSPARHPPVERILQERPEAPHSHQLNREPDFHVLPATPADQRPVLVVQEEHSLQIRLRRRPRIPAVRRRRIIIRQELHRHRPQSRARPPPTHPQRSNRYKNQTPQRRPTSERPVAVTQRSSARYRHWPFRCCSSPITAAGGLPSGRVQGRQCYGQGRPAVPRHRRLGRAAAGEGPRAPRRARAVLRR